MATDTSLHTHEETLEFLKGLFPDKNKDALAAALSRHGLGAVERCVDDLLASDGPELPDDDSGAADTDADDQSVPPAKEDGGFDHQILQQLVDAFPDAELSKVLDCLDESNWDADAAVESLLLWQTLDAEEKNVAIKTYSQVASSASASPSSSSTSAPAMTLILPKHMRDGVINTTKRTIEKNPTHSLHGGVSGSKDPNDASAATMLQAMFPYIDATAISDVVQANGGDVSRAADVLAQWTDRSTLDPRDAHNAAIETLREILPNEPMHRLVSALRESEQDVNRVVTRLMQLGSDGDASGPWSKVRAASQSIGTTAVWDANDAPNTESDQTTAWTEVVRTLPKSRSGRTLSATGLNGSHITCSGVDGGKFVAIAGAARLLPSGMSAVSAQAARASDLTARSVALRSNAKHCHDMRCEAFRSAARSFARGGLTGRGAAGYYAMHGHTMSDRLHDHNMEAARLRLLANSLGDHCGAGDVLDLHGLTVSEAETNSLAYINAWAATSHQTAGRRLRVIVGAGRHSVGGRGMLDGAVRRALVQHGWPVMRGGVGWLLVRRKSQIQTND